RHDEVGLAPRCCRRPPHGSGDPIAGAPRALPVEAGYGDPRSPRSGPAYRADGRRQGKSGDDSCGLPTTLLLYHHLILPSTSALPPLPSTPAPTRPADARNPSPRVERDAWGSPCPFGGLLGGGTARKHSETVTPRAPAGRAGRAERRPPG